MGYYSTGWNDEKLAGIISKAGGQTIRPTLPDHFIEQWGINVRLNAFNYYTGTLGMRDLVCFVEGPSDAHRDWTTYPGSSQPSKLFANLYQPIWNPDGTVNQNNYYAWYIYRLVQTYGSHIRFWEVVNEPDFVNGVNPSEWLTRPPLPAETANTLAPFYHYIRMLRITWEVVKKYNPDDYVTPGGIGYTEYLDALLRYTDNPADGSVTSQYPHKGGAYFDVLSYHVYPSWFLRRWDNSSGGFRYMNTSDHAVNQMISHKNGMESVLTKYGYNGASHPRKHFILTEVNVSRRTSDWQYSSDEMQRNFGIKALVLAQKNNISQVHFFGVGEGVNAPDPSASVSSGVAYGLMGLYENLNRDAPGSEKLTQQGRGLTTTTQLLSGFQYDASRTAAMNLPASAEGGAFVKDGAYVYVLWAKALTDRSENASAVYSFPTAWNMADVERFEWDYSSTARVARLSSQGISLGGSPSFFRPGGVTTTTPAPASTCSGSGTILWEQWTGISGNSVSSIPLQTAPNATAQLTSFEAGTNIGDNYGARIRGYICAPQSGSYTFYIAGDDDCELWLGTDENPANRRRIASFSGWTYPREWAKYTGQRSAAVSLTAGQKYYVEALHKEGVGEDNLAVGWVLPNTASVSVIPGSSLLPFAAATATAACSGNGTILWEQWTGISGNSVSSIPLQTAPNATAQLTSFEAGTNIGDNYGARIRGYICAPQSGSYTFYIAGDDDCELWLGTDENPANRRRIASFSGWTYPREWAKYTGQRSAAVSLTAGRRYYVEALHKEGIGGDNLAVGWITPGSGSISVIPGSNLSPFVTSSAARQAYDGQLRVSPETDLRVFPNPVKDNATVEFRSSESGPVVLELRDPQGRLMQKLFDGEAVAGVSYSCPLRPSGLSSKLYFLQLRTSSKVVMQKVILSR